MTKAKKSKPALPDKVRLELRFDQDVYDRIKDVADKASISVNQLLQGLARWAGPKLMVGEPVRNSEGVVSVNPTAGCVFVGRAGRTYDRDEYEDFKRQTGEELADDRGEVVLALDFTERRVVRDEHAGSK